MDDESQEEGEPEGLSAEASAQVEADDNASDGGSKNAVSKGAGNNGAADFEKMIAERDETIAGLQAQVAEATRSAEATERLSQQIEELKAQAESERVDFQLQLAGCRSVKAARAVLDDHGGDVEALLEAMPWLFEDKGEKPEATGKTGLEPRGVAGARDKDLRRWRRMLGLDGNKDE